jgi:hypothetical protein
MMQMNLRNAAIATSTFACAALLSFGWSEQRGISLSIESAQARIGRPWTPLSVAGVARRQYRRSVYGYGYGAGVVGAGLAAAAVGAAAVAATSPYGYYGNGYYGGGPYVGSGWGYYGGYGTGGYYGSYGGYPGYYGAYAAGGYPGGYYGGYANRSYVTGRPALIPRYYGGWGW